MVDEMGKRGGRRFFFCRWSSQAQMREGVIASLAPSSPFPDVALQGEKLEDEIIEIATVLREKADKMVADSGAINFDVIQPLIDEIAVLKGKYK